MAVEAAASASGKQVVTHAVGTWLGARREHGQRGAATSRFRASPVNGRRAAPA